MRSRKQRQTKLGGTLKYIIQMTRALFPISESILAHSGLRYKYRFIFAYGSYHPIFIDHHINTISTQCQQHIVQPYLPLLFDPIFAKIYITSNIHHSVFTTNVYHHSHLHILLTLTIPVELVRLYVCLHRYTKTYTSAVGCVD